MRGLAGKGVLISGGSSGIGLAAAQWFLEEGSWVFLAGLEPDGVDVLANNAGTSWWAAFLEITVAEWDRIIAVNLRGMFLVARAVTAQMARRGTGGVVINMSSTNGIAGEED